MHDPDTISYYAPDEPDASPKLHPVGIAVLPAGDIHPGTEFDFYPLPDREADADARVHAYWNPEPQHGSPADGDGNPLPDGIRRELAAEQARIDAYFRTGGLIDL